MRRITLWLLSTLSVVVLLFGYDASNATSTTGGATSIVAAGGSSAGSGSAGTSTGSSAGSTSAGTSKGSSASTTVTGAVASTQWGPVQVRLTLAGGDITQVDVLQYPSGNPKDAEINDYALPILTRETTDQQSANIDMVSGATVTSTGYIQSLQSALDQAGS
jgi:uncharacterized protein with FMN-binding domain